MVLILRAYYNAMKVIILNTSQKVISVIVSLFLHFFWLFTLSHTIKSFAYQPTYTVHPFIHTFDKSDMPIISPSFQQFQKYITQMNN